MKKGDKVKMSEGLKEAMRQNGSKEHIKEFGECIGIVEGITYENEDGTDVDVDVRWQPSNLRYGYSINSLVKIN